MRIEDQHPNVLQNIEFAVATFYRDHPQLSDYAVMRTYEALIDRYSAEAAGREARKRELADLERALFDEARRMCEWRLGRADLPNDGSNRAAHSMEPITVEVLVLCLKRLLKSAQTWNKRGGRKGYLEYMSQFIV
jgi:hypothetical protein